MSDGHRLPPDFRLNIEGFEERYLLRDTVGCVTHLSAYSRMLGIEIAVLDQDDKLKLIAAVPRCIENPRDSSGRIWTHANSYEANLGSQFDPIIIRCIALQWVEELNALSLEVTHD